MTRNRDLKALIRARAAKTGERYTTARRHVLARRARHLTDGPIATDAAGRPPVPAHGGTAPIASVKGAVSDAATRDRTGHGLSHWFAILDEFGAVQKGHTAAARHLREVHGVSSWYAQGITVAYERARGLRAPNQRSTGTFEFSASKVLASDVPTVLAAIRDARQRRRWMASADRTLASTLASALDAAGAKGLAIDSRGRARVRYPWSGSRVDIYVEPKRTSKATAVRTVILVTQQNLSSRDLMETRRSQWRGALEALAAYLS